MREVIDVVEGAFRERGAGRVEMPPKIGVHTSAGGYFHAMPAYIPALHAVGVKWVSVYQDNQRRDLPRVAGLLVLNDEETGLPLVVMDGAWVTAMRTGAATAVAARYLANPESAVLGVLGCGIQGRSNLEALREVVPLRHVVAYDVHPDRAAQFVAEVASRWGLSVVQAAEPREAVEASDVVVTAGRIVRPPHATIKAGWLRAGAFASLVDYDAYWDRAAMHETSKFCTDDLGQLEHYRARGYLQDIPPIYATLGELVCGTKPGRQDRHERTMICNLGLALADIATGLLVYRRAVESGRGIWLSA